VVTRQPQVERRTAKGRLSETDVLPLCHATNCVSYDDDDDNDEEEEDEDEDEEEEEKKRKGRQEYHHGNYV